MYEKEYRSSAIAGAENLSNLLVREEEVAAVSSATNTKISNL